MAQKQAPVVGRTGAAPVVIEVTGEGPESNLTLATSTSRLWCRRRSTPRMKKLSAEEKNPRVQHAVNGDRKWPLTPTGLRLDRSTALYIYKAKHCKLLVLFTDAQQTKFIFK
jgi:hypothetical protein